eukprot:COSAG01_NODE_8247_length_2858_cov_1.254078_2_plen_108_part_00
MEVSDPSFHTMQSCRNRSHGRATNRFYKLRRHFEPHPRLDYFVKQLHNITQISWQQRRSFEVPEFQKSHQVNLALVWGPEARLVVLQHAFFSQHITYLTAPICCATC